MKNKINLKDQIIKIVYYEKLAGITPKQVYNILQDKATYSNIRSIMFRLAREGKLIANYKDNKGFYGLSETLQNSIDGINNKYKNYSLDKSLLWQNITIIANLGRVLEHYEEIREYPLFSKKPIWKIHIVIGKNNKKLTIKFSGAPGYDPRSIMIVADSIIREFNAKFNLNIDLKDVKFKTVEMLNDIVDVKMSENSISFDVMNRNLLKVYNKKFGVRLEHKHSVEIPYIILLKSFSDPTVMTYVNDINSIKQDINYIKNTIFFETKLNYKILTDINRKLDIIMKINNFKKLSYTRSDKLIKEF